MKPEFSLGYHAVPTGELVTLLTKYQGVHHQQLIRDFEQKIADTLSAAGVVCVNSGTSAIHLALKALGVSQGDTVVVPTFTYVATVNPIRYLGAEPVFVDADPFSWNIDVASLHEALRALASRNQLPKAIIVVHTYGQASDMKAIMQLANEYGVPVLEDAAESIGTKYGDQFTGTLGSIGVLSFNNNKIVTAFGGGAVISNQPEVLGKIAFWASQSRSTNRNFYEHHEVGYNYRLSPLQAAVGLLEIDLLEARIAQRHAVTKEYERLGWLALQGQLPNTRPNHWMIGAEIQNMNVTPDAVLNKLDQAGVEARRVWKPMHTQPAFSGCQHFGGVISEALFQTGLCLPSEPQAANRAMEVLRTF